LLHTLGSDSEAVTEVGVDDLWTSDGLACD
jgi:hypothetical protein